MRLPLRVIGDRVLIQPDVEDHAPTETESGLVLAPTLAAAVAGQDVATSYTSGVIVALGSDTPCTKCGRGAIDFRIGDRVTFSWKSGQEVTIDNLTYVIMRARDVLAVLDEVPV